MDTLETTTSPRARRVRRVLARWQRSGLTLRQFADQERIPFTTLTWWLQEFHRDYADIGESGLALFTHEELDALKHVPDEMARAIHAAKRAFPRSKIRKIHLGW